ncbi:RTA1 like protein-domain-containing protein [Flagelloscypha sp. PMI_526]|nr:RTA1 like protein-domain-containing protein [Flagelloscypha sp. PMI_526]
MPLTTIAQSLPAAQAFSILYGLVALAHLFQAFQYRKRFCWVIIMATAWETASFILRWLSLYDIDPSNFAEYGQILVMLAPLWINAFCYMVLGRVILYFIPEKRIWGVSARRLSLIFVLLDILPNNFIRAFGVQATGAVIANNSEKGSQNYDKQLKLGLHIYQGGVGLQEFFVVIFFAIAVRTHLEISRFHNTFREQNWRKVRVIYRLCEYSGGFDSGLVTQEKWFYVLEAAPMWICLLLFNLIHPGYILVGPESEFPKKQKKGKKEVDLEKQGSSPTSLQDAPKTYFKLWTKTFSKA